MRRGGIPIFGAALLVLAGTVAADPATGTPPSAADARVMLAQGENPYPVHLVRPESAPLSAMAQLGHAIFHDTSLSASGRQACASCHDPANHYGPPGSLPAMLGGPTLHAQGDRAVPSLTYLEGQPPFSVGPDNEEDETSNLAQMIASGGTATRAVKTAIGTAQSAASVVPQGGLFWDGRVDTLQQQASQPLLNPVEMANTSAAAAAAKLRHTPYAPRFVQLFGPGILGNASLLLSEAMFTVARYQIEDASFHPYTSKFDFWLDGRARLAPAEMRGYVLFNDPHRANCGGCHLDQAGRDGQPPRFTDDQFEALGAPRNPALANTRDPYFFDLGICGPFRTDMQAQTQYCGMFLTPTLRNVATRHAFFHNGVFHSLLAVMDFYNNRDVAPEKVYPRNSNGTVAKFNDIPLAYRANVDAVDPPLNRHLGDAPAMTVRDELDIIAFLETLTDGYRVPAR
jgi:cytochrome c peroxidase